MDGVFQLHKNPFASSSSHILPFLHNLRTKTLVNIRDLKSKAEYENLLLLISKRKHVIVASRWI